MAVCRDKRAARVTGITRAYPGPVIACLDDGRGGIAVARVAALLADGLRARLILATVQPAAAEPGQQVRRGRQLLARIARELDQPAERHVATGEPAERLIALADIRSAGIVVIGAASLEPVEPSRLGNAFLALAGAVACPVVLVPREMEALPAPGGPIACHVDGSPSSLAAVRFAAALSDVLNAELQLVSSTRMPLGGAYGLSQMIVSAAGPRRPTGPSRQSSSGISSLVAAAGRPLVLVPGPVPPRFVPQRLVLTSERVRSSSVLHVTGEIDMATSPQLEARAIELLEGAGAEGRLVLDLSGTVFMDVGGLHAMHRLARRAAQLGGRLVVVATRRPVRRLLEIVPHPWLIEAERLDAAVHALDDAPEPTDAHGTARGVQSRRRSRPRTPVVVKRPQEEHDRQIFRE